MEYADSSLFTPDFAYENGLDFSSLLTPSTFSSVQEAQPIIQWAGIENNGRQRICEVTVTDGIPEGDEGQKNKKRAKHKEIERQRRQEATSLFKNLRYILPCQYIKGKRSSSDHVLEALNYIKDLQKKIKEDTKKRDRIKRCITHPFLTRESSIRSSSVSSNCSCVGDRHVDVVVRPCLNGIEIVASYCFRHESSLSSVLELLAQEQCFNVISCISTRMHERFIHTIVSEVEKGIEVYFSELQENIIKMGTSLLSPY